MDCRDFLDRLDRFLEGKLTDAERRAAEDHLGDCRSCRVIERLARTDLPPLDPPDDLTESILHLTSGSPCASAESLLCDHVDGTARAVDAELTRLHLDGCKECAALARTLVLMSEELPSMAEIEPDAGFVDDVLRATLPLHARLGRRFARWNRAWQQVLRRPRIAWEGAYLGTFVLVMIFAVPGSPLAAVPQKALELARTNPAVELREPMVEIEVRISGAWQVTGRRASGAFEQIKTDLGTVLDRIASQKESDDDASPAKDGPAQGDRNERTR